MCRSVRCCHNHKQPTGRHQAVSFFALCVAGGSGGTAAKDTESGGWKQLIWFRNIFCVFTFVALWHDMTLQLLVWGWLSAIAFVPEAVVGWLGSLPMVEARFHKAWWLPNLIALLGAVNVLLLIVANMIGFATAAAADGSGAAGMLAALATRHGMLLLGGATIMLCVSHVLSMHTTIATALALGRILPCLLFLCVTCITNALFRAHATYLNRCMWSRWRLRYNGVIVMIEIRAAEALISSRGSQSPLVAESRGDVLRGTDTAADAGRGAGSRSPSPSPSRSLKHRAPRGSCSTKYQ